MKKILIVDDLMTFVEREKSILSRADFQIFTATSGKQALDIHKAENVDLIIADLDMPDLGGDRLCTVIRNDKRLKDVSIIIVCSGSRKDLERIGVCGANSHLTKPIKPVQFLEKVGQLLGIPERKNYRVILKVTVNGEARSDSFFCSSRDISITGMLIETEKILSKGDSISCSFFLPNSDRITADAEVIRIVQNDKGYQYGIRYINMDPRFRVAIDGFIAKRSGKA